MFQHAAREPEFQTDVSELRAGMTAIALAELADRVTNPSWARWAAQLCPTVSDRRDHRLARRRTTRSRLHDHAVRVRRSKRSSGRANGWARTKGSTNEVSSVADMSTSTNRLTKFYGEMSPSLDAVLSALVAAGVDMDHLQASDLYRRDLDCHNLGMHRMLEVLKDVAAEYGEPSPEETVLDVG